MQDWSAKQYLKFEEERTRPSRDLANAVPLKAPGKIVDIGCGPGNSTEVLLQKWPLADISGFDASPDMIEKAKQRLPNVSFEIADLYQWQPQPDVDLLFSNAVFQWMPDHIKEMQRLLNSLKRGGVLAVQMPDNLDAPSHLTMAKIAQDERWKDRIGHTAREKLPGVSVYYDAFRPFTSKIDIWHTVYNHVLESHEAIVEWVKGTGLRPFLDPLDKQERDIYLSLYLQALKKAYPLQKDGKVLLPFSRIFLIFVK